MEYEKGKNDMETLRKMKKNFLYQLVSKSIENKREVSFIEYLFITFIEYCKVLFLLALALGVVSWVIIIVCGLFGIDYFENNVTRTTGAVISWLLILAYTLVYIITCKRVWLDKKQEDAKIKVSRENQKHAREKQ